MIVNDFDSFAALKPTHKVVQVDICEYPINAAGLLYVGLQVTYGIVDSLGQVSDTILGQIHGTT